MSYITNKEYELVELRKILITPLISSYLEENNTEFDNEVVPECSGMARTRLDTIKLENITDCITNYIPLPPIQVNKLYDGNYEIINGMHRTAMFITLGFTHILVSIENKPIANSKLKHLRINEFEEIVRSLMCQMEEIEQNMNERDRVYEENRNKFESDMDCLEFD